MGESRSGDSAGKHRGGRKIPVREFRVAHEPCKYKPQSGETVVYRGRQWVVVAAPKDLGGGFVLHHEQQWFYANELGHHEPNWHNADVEYSTFSHYAGKGFDLDDWEAVYRFACSYFRIDTASWLDQEIAHELARRGILDPNGPIGGHNKLAV
jgi:hypothetical protein